MEDEEENIVEDEPLKVMELFPRRISRTLDLNLHSFVKIYQQLLCPICHDLIKSPSYLKCSHRFCKQCIQKHLRTSLNKSCYVCQGDLATKRDLRYDSPTESLIKYIFKDPKLFTSSLEQPFLRSRSFDHKRLQSQQDVKSRTQNQSQQLPTTIKRTRTADGQESKKKKRLVSDKKIQSKVLINTQKDSTPLKRISKKFQQKQSVKSESKIVLPKIETPSAPQPPLITEIVSQVAKKKKVVINLDFDSEPEPEPQKRIQEIHKEENMSIEVEQPNACSISVLPEAQTSGAPHLSRVQSAMPQLTPPKSNKSTLDVMVPQQIGAKHSLISPQVLKAIQILKGDFGDSFPKKIIELTTFPFCCQISLQPHPESILTPKMVNSKFRFYLKTQISALFLMVAQIFNEGRENISIYVKNVENVENYFKIDLNSKLKLYEVNEVYWRHWKGIQMLDISEALNYADDPQSIMKKYERILYYSVSKHSNIFT